MAENNGPMYGSMNMKHVIKYVIWLWATLLPAVAQAQGTYSEKLGWGKQDRVIIFHVDDVGMSYESNTGAILALSHNIATSFSIMMPCPWVPQIASYIRQHPGLDAGLHLTFTSEWKDYRWPPVSGQNKTPGLLDSEGALWSDTRSVLNHATAQEIETEMEAQYLRAIKMGITPTHLDTHMGTLWSSREFVERYVKFGIARQVPVLFSAGHNTLMLSQLEDSPLMGLKSLVNASTKQRDIDKNSLNVTLHKIGQQLWDGGLAVADDLDVSSYDWVLPPDVEPTDENLRKFKVEKYKNLLRSTRPGVTVILMHCTDAGAGFETISDSGAIRRADMLAMLDKDLKEFIAREGFILTTWSEMQKRRNVIAE